MLFHSQNQNDIPLWKWLLNPKRRAQLHENRKLPDPPTFSSSSSSANNSKTNNIINNGSPFVSHDVSLWKWRMKMQSIMAQGQTIAVGSSPKSPDQQHTNYYYHVSNSSNSSGNTNTSRISARKKSDFRFAAKTLVPNLISEIQSRNLGLVMMNVTPLNRNSLFGSNRMDSSLPETRIASLELLQRAATGNHETRLSEEFFEWKSCMFSMMVNSSKTSSLSTASSASASASASVTTSTRTKSVVVPQSVFVTVGARMGQLLTLSETTSDDIHVNSSLEEFKKILERDWALTVIAQNGERLVHHTFVAAGGSCDRNYNNNKNGAGGDGVGGREEFSGVAFATWFTNVLLPVAVVLAPPHASLIEDSMLDNAVDFLSTLRSILFPTIAAAAGRRGDVISDSDTHETSKSRQAHSSPSSISRNRPHSHRRNQSPVSSASTVVVVGGDLSKNPIHHSFVYEQRLVTSGFPSQSKNENPYLERMKDNASPLRPSTSSPSSVTTRKAPRSSPTPRSSSPNQQQQQQQKTNVRKLPKVIEELMMKQELLSLKRQKVHSTQNSHEQNEPSSPDRFHQQQHQQHRPPQYPSSEDIMRGVHQTIDGRISSSPHTIDFHQPFPRNTSSITSPSHHNRNDKTTSTSTTLLGSPIKPIQIKFRGPVVATSSSPTKKHALADDDDDDHHHNTKKQQHDALGVHVRSSVVTRFSSSPSHQSKSNTNEEVRLNFPPSSSFVPSDGLRSRNMMHSKQLGRKDSILKVMGVRSKEEEEREEQERKRLKRAAMSSTGRSLKNRSPSELHMRTLC